MFMGSTQLASLTRRYGNHKITAVGMIALGLYPTTLSLATGPTMFMVSMGLAGFAWALGGTAMINYLLEAVPSENSAGYMAWFTVGTNIAILLGNSVGPLIAAWIGLPIALFLFGLLRSLAGVIILRRG
jgi:MFS family permease